MRKGSRRPAGGWSRRQALAAGLTGGIVLTAGRRAAAALGSVDIMAPAGPGGGYDQLARATQQVLQERGLASNVQVTNVPGAGGTVGLAQFVTGRKRGTQLMVAGLGLVGAVLINKSPVSLQQTTPLARLTGEYQPLVVAASSPIRNLDDLLAQFRAEPGSVSWGGFALGSPDHLLSAMVVKGSGGDVRQMNYIVAGAGGEMLAQVLGGHITVATGGLNEMAQQLAAGKLRALGLSSPERLPGVDIPTFREQGVDAVLVNWRGLMAPPELRPADLAALDAAMGMMVKSPEWASIVADRGWIDLYLPSGEFEEFLEAERPRIEAVIRELGLA